MAAAATARSSDFTTEEVTSVATDLADTASRRLPGLDDFALQTKADYLRITATDYARGERSHEDVLFAADGFVAGYRSRGYDMPALDR